VAILKAPVDVRRIVMMAMIAPSAALPSEVKSAIPQIALGPAVAKEMIFSVGAMHQNAEALNAVRVAVSPLVVHVPTAVKGTIFSVGVMLQNGEDLSAARATLSLVVVLAPVAVIVRIILAVLTVQSVARQIVARVVAGQIVQNAPVAPANATQDSKARMAPSAAPPQIGVAVQKVPVVLVAATAQSVPKDVVLGVVGGKLFLGFRILARPVQRTFSSLIERVIPVSNWDDHQMADIPLTADFCSLMHPPGISVSADCTVR